MASIMSEIIVDLKRMLRTLNKKGQGIVEFALICAFCAVISLFIRGVGFSEAFYEALNKSTPELYSAAIASNPRSNYMDYYDIWSQASIDSIKHATKPDGKPYTKEDRVEADQKALVKIAETYLGKTENQVFGLMETFANSLDDNEPAYVNNLKCQKVDGVPEGTGFSENVLVPLSYKANTLEKNIEENDPERKKGWLWLEQNNNQNTVAYLTNNKATTYDKYDSANPSSTNPNNRQTATTDRIFYSEEMLTANKGRVTVRLHYTDGKVDFVDVALRKSFSNDTDYAGTIASGLCLHVTEAGHNVISNPGTGKNDIINKPTDYYDVYGTRL